MSRFHLAMLAVEFGGLPEKRAADLHAGFARRIDDAVRYSRECFEDEPDIRNWKWTKPEA
jgi:phosphoketolase